MLLFEVDTPEEMKAEIIKYLTILRRRERIYRDDTRLNQRITESRWNLLHDLISDLEEASIRPSRKEKHEEISG